MFEGVDKLRAGWVALGLVLAAIVGYVVLAFLGTVVFGIFLYYATRPAHLRIRPYIGQRTVSALLSLFVLALPFVLLVVYAAAIAFQELGRIAQRVDFGPYTETVNQYLDVSQVVDDPQVALDQLGDPQAMLDVVGSALGYLGLIGNGLLSLFVAFAIAFYLLRDAHRLSEFGALANDERGLLKTYWRAVDESLSDVFFGNILNALLTGAIGAIAYSLLNLIAPAKLAIPYPALIGVLAGAGSLIPIVGMKIVYVPLLLFLAGRAAILGTGYQFVAIATAVSFLVVDVIPDIMLRPYVSGGSLHTGTVMLAYILGPVFFGWYGLFLGPLILVLVTHFVRLVLPELLAGERIVPETRDPGELAAADAAEEAEERGPGSTSAEASDAGAGNDDETASKAARGSETDGDEHSTADSDTPPSGDS